MEEKEAKDEKTGKITLNRLMEKLPQLCNLTLVEPVLGNLLFKMLVELCGRYNNIIPLRMYFYYQGAIEDGLYDKYKLEQMRDTIESNSINKINISPEEKVKECFNFQTQLDFLQYLMEISRNLKEKSQSNDNDNSSLNNELMTLISRLDSRLLNNSLNDGISLPFVSSPCTVIRLLPRDSFILASRTHVVYMLWMETVNPSSSSFSSPDSSFLPPELAAFLSPLFPPIPDQSHPIKERLSVPSKHFNSGKDPQEECDLESERAVVMIDGEEFCVVEREQCDSLEEEQMMRLIYGHVVSDHKENALKREQQTKKENPEALDWERPGWCLRSAVVKHGDDCRQEELAQQIVRLIHSKFVSSNLPIYLRPYEVISMGSQGGLVETVPNAVSLDNIRKKLPDLPLPWLTHFFLSAHKSNLRTALRNFVESLAGASLVSYIVNLKDRHNGNILLDSDGHIIHIDYGFMFTSSPGGNWNFETAPFKFTQDIIQLLGGDQSDLFRYFKTLLIAGFLEIRRYSDELIWLVQNMLPGERLNCFVRQKDVIPELRKRLCLNKKTDQECIEQMECLVKESSANWRTLSYDSFQYYANGIFP